MRYFNTLSIHNLPWLRTTNIAQSAGAVEYTDYTSEVE